MKIIWDSLKTSLTTYFDGNGDGSIGATQSPFKLENTLLYNNQDNSLEEQIQYLYPLAYVSFDVSPEWQQLPYSIQWAPVEFTIRFEYESYLEAEDDLDIFSFKTALVNFIEQQTEKNEDFVMNAPKRLSETKEQLDNNILSYTILFQVNVTDKSMYKLKYGIIDDWVMTTNIIKEGCGRPIEVISGGTASTSPEDLVGNLSGDCVDLDGIDGGDSYPDEDLNVDGGDSTSY